MPRILARNRSEKLGLVSASCKHRSLNRMLKKSASVHETWRVTREICEKGAIRSSKFEVSKTPSFGPRTLRHLAHPASLARLSCAVLSCCCRRTGHRSSAIWPLFIFRDPLPQVRYLPAVSSYRLLVLLKPLTEGANVILR
jgi:hypothetical protein